MSTPENESQTVNSSASDTRKPRRMASVLAVIAIVAGALLAGQLLPLHHELRPAGMPAEDDTAMSDPEALAPTLKRQAAANMLDLEFRTLDGKKATLASFIGRPVVLNFWATWCAPCIKEMPELNAIARTYAKQNIRVVAVSLNATAPEARDWLLAHKLTEVIPVMDSGGKELAKLGQTGLPTTLLIREDGSLAERLDGFRKWAAPEMKQKVEALLKK